MAIESDSLADIYSFANLGNEEGKSGKSPKKVVDLGAFLGEEEDEEDGEGILGGDIGKSGKKSKN